MLLLRLLSRVRCQKLQRKLTNLGAAYLCKRTIDLIFEETKDVIDSGFAGGCQAVERGPSEEHGVGATCERLYDV